MKTAVKKDHDFCLVEYGQEPVKEQVENSRNQLVMVLLIEVSIIKHTFILLLN